MLLALLQLFAASLSPDAQAMLEDTGVVRIQFVRADHWSIDRGQTAKALVANGGAKFIMVNLDAPGEDLDQVIMHEMAHHVAWVRHGHDIAEHGPEFLRVCRELVTRRQAYFCKGD